MKAKLVKHVSGYILYDEKNITIGAEPNVLSSSIFSKLSLKNCQAIELGYDLDELADEHYNVHVKRGHTKEDSLQRMFDFIIGFQKAVELMGDKKFSEEDVISMIEKSRETGLTAQYLFLTKQQTEWDVTVEMEYVGECNGNNDEGCFQDSPGHNCGCFERRPKLDADGCLILKRA